jgi:hypothetical protein
MARAKSPIEKGPPIVRENGIVQWFRPTRVLINTERNNNNNKNISRLSCVMINTERNNNNNNIINFNPDSFLFASPSGL